MAGHLDKAKKPAQKRAPAKGAKTKTKSAGFPDLSGDGKTTMKDILIGRGVIPRTKKAKGGKTMPKHAMKKKKKTMKKRVKAMGGGAMKKRVMKRGGGAMNGKRVMKRGGGAMNGKRVMRRGGGMGKKDMM